MERSLSHPRAGSLSSVSGEGQKGVLSGVRPGFPCPGWGKDPYHIPAGGSAGAGPAHQEPVPVLPHQGQVIPAVLLQGEEEPGNGTESPAPRSFPDFSCIFLDLLIRRELMRSMHSSFNPNPPAFPTLLFLPSSQILQPFPTPLFPLQPKSSIPPRCSLRWDLPHSQTSRTGLHFSPGTLPGIKDRETLSFLLS